MTRTAIAVRLAPVGKLHHLLADALPIGWHVTTFGPDGGRATSETGTVIVSRAFFGDTWWVHASRSFLHRLPSYAELADLHSWVFGDGHAYQVFVPPAEHVNHHPFCLHLWGRADGDRALPDFTRGLGTI